MLKTILAAFLIIAAFTAPAQSIDSIAIPRGVVYKYGDPAIVEKAKQKIRKELTDSVSCSLGSSGILFIGPSLWARYVKVPALQQIEGGNLTLMGGTEKLTGKVTQDEKGFKLVWDHLRSEVGKEYIFRKATAKELLYYWSVINFDIEEPLLIVENKEHRYIMNLTAKDLKLLWLDEVPPGVK